MVLQDPLGEFHCVICDLPITDERHKLFSRDPANHPGILGDVHPECYDAACEEEPDLPWEDPISGEVDYQEMAAALGIWPGSDDDLWEEDPDGY